MFFPSWFNVIETCNFCNYTKYFHAYYFEEKTVISQEDSECRIVRIGAVPLLFEQSSNFWRQISFNLDFHLQNQITFLGKKKVYHHLTDALKYVKIKFSQKWMRIPNPQDQDSVTPLSVSPPGAVAFHLPILCHLDFFFSKYFLKIS